MLSSLNFGVCYWDAINSLAISVLVLTKNSWKRLALMEGSIKLINANDGAYVREDNISSW